MADSDDDEPITLNGVQEDDFNRWRHHPVTKVFLRYLMDRERQLAEKQIAINRNIQKSSELDPFLAGEFKGQINALFELRELRFAHIAAFYAENEEEDE